MKICFEESLQRLEVDPAMLMNTQRMICWFQDDGAGLDSHHHRRPQPARSYEHADTKTRDFMRQVAMLAILEQMR